MRYVRQFLGFVSIAGAIVIVTGCAYQAALQQLTPEEQTTFRAHSKMMTATQAYTYLRKTTAAERAAYLEEIGTAQRFQALTPQDRETVLAGFPRVGMSADAMRFLWGEPYYTKGYTGHYEYWYYLGSAMSLAESGNIPTEAGTIVVVDLVDGKVEGWLETTPTNVDTGDADDKIR